MTAKLAERIPHRIVNVYQRTGQAKVPDPNNPKARKTNRKGGYPPKPIDWDLVERLSMIHCTPAEIAAVCRISYVALIQREEFPAVYSRGWERGKASLRRLQWRKAVEGDVRMLTFLGRVVLGQRENTVIGESATPEEDAARPQLQALTNEELQTLRSLVEKASNICASEDTKNLLAQRVQ